MQPDSVQNVLNNSETHPIPTGLSDLDAVLNGLQEGNLYSIAGRPGMGKTSLALTILRNTILNLRKSVALFTFEMTKAQVLERLRLMEGTGAFSNGIIDTKENVLLIPADSLSNAKIYLYDDNKAQMEDIAERCREVTKTKGIHLVIIDDVQRIYHNVSGNDNREQLVSANVRELKALARELRIPILLLSQLNRNVDLRGGSRRPMLSDLKDSDTIAQEADAIVLLYRAEYYGFTEDENNNSTKGVAELIIAKNRYGPLKTVYAKFIDNKAKFVDVRHG